MVHLDQQNPDTSTYQYYLGFCHSPDFQFHHSELKYKDTVNQACKHQLGIDVADSDSLFWLKFFGARSVGLVDELATTEGDLPAQ